MVDKKKIVKNLEKAKKIIKKVKERNPNAKINLTTYLSEHPIKDYYINALIVAIFKGQAMTEKDWKIVIKERINKPMGSAKEEEKENKKIGQEA